MTADHTIFRYENDGLGLAGRLHGDLAETALPFVCLPGLTRNSRDFEAFGAAIRAGPSPRPVVAFDYRGRGLSDRLADASGYTLALELADIAAGLRHLGIERAIFVGTSRGALLIHLLGLHHPHLLAGAVLNDAGPRLEIAGLLAIKAYVGKTTRVPDWPTATARVASINGPTFPALTRVDFERMARANFVETAEGVDADYDSRLADGLAGIEADTALPELWDAFDALRSVPVLAIRGEHSMLFARETLQEMANRHPSIETVEVAGQGHAPLLETAGLPDRIAAFAFRIDRRS